MSTDEITALRAQLDTARGLLAKAVAQLRIEFATYHSGCDESRCELARLLAFLAPVQHAAPVASDVPTHELRQWCGHTRGDGRFCERPKGHVELHSYVAP